MDEVLDEVKEIELRHIKQDVFSVYSPKIYKRRAVSGIDDLENIVGTVKDMELEVENITEFNRDYGTFNSGRGLSTLINDGESLNGHFYDYPGEFTQPRPFIDRTIEELENSNRLDNAMIKGLKRRGIEAN